MCSRPDSPAKVNVYGNPSRVAPAPTKPAIDVRDLQIRLYQFADDSMRGRQVGRSGNQKGTDYLAVEVKRLGLLPAGTMARTSSSCRITFASSPTILG